MSKEKFIDIESLIASKNPKALKRTPKFILRYLKRILHEKEINQFLIDNKDKKNAEWCEAVVHYMNIDIKVINAEKIPKDDRIILAMNHPLGGMDAMILVSALKGKREDLKFIVNDLLMNLDAMKDMFVGVNKHGKNKASTRVLIKDLFEGDDTVCIFPAGLVSRKKSGKVRDLVWKKTFVQYAKSTNRTIIPIYIDGRLSNFFYRLSSFRSLIGVKTNIEMLYLANELFKQRNRKMKFVVGDPIERDYLMANDDDFELAQEIKDKVYELRKQI